MKIIILWKKETTQDLFKKVKSGIDDLWLTDFIVLEEKIDNDLKKELNITKEPALVIEEESIEFKDTIFEWIVPEEEEIKSMLISIIWWDSSEWWGCAPGGCGSWCSC